MCDTMKNSEEEKLTTGKRKHRPCHESEKTKESDFIGLPLAVSSRSFPRLRMPEILKLKMCLVYLRAAVTLGQEGSEGKC